MKKCILIDMYGVIVKESKGRFIPYILEHFDKGEHSRLMRQIREEQLFTRAGNGEMSSDEFLMQLGFDNPEYHMKNYIENYLTLDEGFIEFAEKYCDRFDFVLLSNDVSEWSRYITQYYQLDSYFLNKIVSGNVKCRKPQKEIYELTLECIKRQPEECFFIDNSVKNLNVAEELGIIPILFNRDNEAYNGIIVDNFRALEKFFEDI